MNNSSTDKNNKISGITISLVLHGALLFVCYFFLKLYPPNPPLSDFGLAVNFGTEAAGFGQVQSTDNTSVENTEPTATEVPPATEPLPENNPTPTADTKESVLTTSEDSPVEVPEDPKPAEKSRESRKPDPIKPEPLKKEPQKKEPLKREPAREPGKTQPTEARPEKNQSPEKGGNNNNGNKKGSTGDQGDPKGSLDERLNFDGKPTGKGGTSGSSLEMTGWKWDDKPEPKETSDEEGKIVFEIKVDETGEIINVRTLEKTVSPAVEKIYRKEVEKLTFSKTRDNVKPASESTGKITFIIRAK
jgi:periplasmic protein TonB